MVTKKPKQQKQFYGTGRRKTSTARVFLRPGSGEIKINDRELANYFPREDLQILVKQPFIVAQLENRFDAHITVKGGGIAGQAGAVSHGIARALIVYDRGEEDGSEGSHSGEDALGLKKMLRQAGLVTRDARKVERKKVGRHKARKGTQYSKR